LSIAGCYSNNNDHFSSPWNVEQALRKANIELVNIWNDSCGLYHADAAIGTLNIPIQFPWPLNRNGTIQMRRHKSLPVPEIYGFAETLTKQVGVSGSLPPFQLVGVGNFGFSINILILSFVDGNLSSMEMAFSIPGWDALNKFQFKVVQPKLRIQIGFLPSPHSK